MRTYIDFLRKGQALLNLVSLDDQGKVDIQDVWSSIAHEFTMKMDKGIINYQGGKTFPPPS